MHLNFTDQESKFHHWIWCTVNGVIQMNIHNMQMLPVLKRVQLSHLT